MPQQVEYHSTIKTNFGVINCGGWINWGNGDQKCWRLTALNTWVPFPNMNIGRYGFAMGEANNRVVAVGGVYTEKSMEWISLDERREWTRQALPFSNHESCLSKYNDTHLLLIGGYFGDDVSE